MRSSRTLAGAIGVLDGARVVLEGKMLDHPRRDLLGVSCSSEGLNGSETGRRKSL
jgi:hypothetical protein